MTSSNPLESLVISPAKLEHVDAIWSLQCDCYDPPMQESKGTFESIVRQGMSLVAVVPRKEDEEEEEEEVVGFLLAHRHCGGSWPLLHDPIEECPQDCPRLYIHDLSVRKDARGTGVGSRLVRAWLAAVAARRHAVTAVLLVSVNGTRSFWERFGFSPCSPYIEEDELGRLRTSYGMDCMPMSMSEF